MVDIETGNNQDAPEKPALGSFLPDVLTERMVVVASRFFLKKQAESSEALLFREDIQNLYEAEPLDGRMVFAAGLIVARFSIGSDPVSVQRPRKYLYDAPHNLLDPYVFTKYQRIGPTLAEMGARAIDKESSRYDDELYSRVIHATDS